MIKALCTLTFVTALFASPVASACMEPDTLPFRQELARANNVFIFRLTSLELADTAPGSRTLTGTVEILRTLKGSGSAFRQLAYSAPWCYGLRLEVGHYYLAATTQRGAILHLVRGDRSVMDVSQDYAQTYPPPRESQKLQWHVANYLKGIPFPATFRDDEYTARTSGIHPVPPPRSR